MTFFSNLSSLFSREIKKQHKAKAPGQLAVKPAQPKSKVQSKPAQQFKEQPRPQQPIQVKQKPTFSPEEIAREKEALLRESKAQAREIVVEAKDEALEIKAKTEQSARQQEQELTQRGRVLDNKIDKLDRRLDEMEQRDKHLETEKTKLEQIKVKLDETKEKLLKRLEEISGMTEQEATAVLLDGLEKQLTQQMAKLVREKEEEAQLEVRDKAQEILIEAMRHGATDYVAEFTVSVINIPSEEVKGKIIGKSGRNIHSFGRKTGVDLDLDYSDTEVRLSCFDPVRREIARIALERLIKDGRIQPARIEQEVDKVKSEVELIMFDAGKDLCQRVGVYNLPHELVKFLGRFKYRSSYGQNMIKHTLEETKIGVKVANELGLDANVVKLGCLLHDIGKVSENPDENHVAAGVRIAKKFNMPQEVVDCIAQHHEDEPFSSPEAMAVYIADAISGARPGARYENIDEYFERLEGLEQIATSYSEVEEAYAVKAGREIRVLLSPEKSKDDDVMVLANKIKEKIENKLTYPGSVTVNVIRETRFSAIAK
jgi:ribonuclease Y